MAQRWQPRKGLTKPVNILVCNDNTCGDSILHNHRHCPCGCGSITTTEPLALRICQGCGDLCFRNDWDRRSQLWLCLKCLRKAYQRRRKKE